MPFSRRLSALALAAALLVTALRAQTHVTWTGATSSSWNDGTNWTPMNIPNGNADTATFDASSGAANVTVTSGVNLRALFHTSDALASTLTFNRSVTFYGEGISNSSAFTQSFVINTYTLAFANSSSAGSGVTITNNSGALYFQSSSNAGTAAITNASYLQFNTSASAGYATILNNNSTIFSSNTTAGEATITNNGTLTFEFSATAGSATITNNGSMSFSYSATGGSAAITNGASGTIDLTNGPSDQSFGSLAGGGTVLMAYGTLTVGSLNTDTTFSGVIDDSSIGTSLTKVGTGTLRLTGSNNYSSLTTVSAGTLLANNSSGFVFGTGNSVDVENGATLGGSGLIGNNDVSILAGGHLAPGDGVGTLSINNNLILQNGAILDFQLGTVSDRINTGLTGGTLYGPGTPGGITLNLTDAGGFAAGTYLLIDFTGGYASLDATDFTLGTRIAGYDYSFNLTGTTFELIATTAIPEPSTYAALAGAAALGLALFRRRQRLALARAF